MASLPAAAVFVQVVFLWPVSPQILQFCGLQLEAARAKSNFFMNEGAPAGAFLELHHLFSAFFLLSIEIFDL